MAVTSTRACRYQWATEVCSVRNWWNLEEVSQPHMVLIQTLELIRMAIIILGEGWGAKGEGSKVKGDRLQGDRWRVRDEGWGVRDERWRVRSGRGEGWEVRGERWAVKGEEWEVRGERWGVRDERWAVRGEGRGVRGERWEVRCEGWWKLYYVSKYKSTISLMSSLDPPSISTSEWMLRSEIRQPIWCHRSGGINQDVTQWVMWLSRRRCYWSPSRRWHFYRSNT